MKKNKTQHNPEKLATQGTQDKEKQNTTQRNWQHRVHKTKKNKTQHNPEKLTTQDTQDKEKQNTTQSRETGNIQGTQDKEKQNTTQRN